MIYSKVKLFALFIVCVFSMRCGLVQAQTNEQLWLEYMLNIPFANSYNIENAVTYSTVLGTPKWRSLGYQATLSYTISPHFEIQTYGSVGYTKQTESYNSLELRPGLGTKIYFTPNKRIDTRLLLRYEQRNIEDLETKAWQLAYRPRIRAEVVIPFNRKSIYDNDLWYGITDAEWLFTTNDIDERYANQFRLRVGLGYRLNYTFRFELMYMFQESKNTINDSFTSADNVIRIRLKHYLRKAKPSMNTAVDN